MKRKGMNEWDGRKEEGIEEGRGVWGDQSAISLSLMESILYYIMLCICTSK